MKISGIHINSKLKFNGHLACLCTKAGRQLNVLQPIRKSCIMWAEWLFATVSLFQTQMIALLSGCSPVCTHGTNLRTFRSLRHDLFAVTLHLVTPNHRKVWLSRHYDDVIMGAIAHQTTSLTIVYSTVYSGADQRKHQSSASLAFVRGIHRRPVNSLHKWPVTRKCFHLMTSSWGWNSWLYAIWEWKFINVWTI